MRIISKQQQNTTKWSGGLTTELYIYPEDSVYTERNFNYRLSTATVEIETSTFTPLEGIKRTLMVLEGNMELIHQGHHSANLSPLMSDSFQGDWKTDSIGTCIDFNLMCKNGALGNLTGYGLAKDQSLELSLRGVHNHLYLYKGIIEIDGETIEEGTLIIQDDKTDLSIDAIANSTLVVVEIVDLGA